MFYTVGDDEGMADMTELRARERELLLAHVEDHVEDARNALDAVTRAAEDGTGPNSTSNDAGLVMLDALATTRDAAADAVRTLAVQLVQRGARAQDVAKAALTTSNTVHRWKREAAGE